MRLSYNRVLGGVWVGVFAGGKSDDALMCKIAEALKLIQQYDPARYRRLLRDVERIWITPLIGAQGQFSFFFKRYSLDYRFAQSATVETIASTIVHEATHGHPWLRKMGYPDALRPRIEKLCFQQELIFLRKLPAATSAMDDVERNLSRDPSFWSDKTFSERRPNEELEALRSYGVPDWIAKSLQAIRRIRRRFHRKQN